MFLPMRPELAPSMLCCVLALGKWSPKELFILPPQSAIRECWHNMYAIHRHSAEYNMMTFRIKEEYWVTERHIFKRGTIVLFSSRKLEKYSITCSPMAWYGWVSEFKVWLCCPFEILLLWTIFCYNLKLYNGIQLFMMAFKNSKDSSNFHWLVFYDCDKTTKAYKNQFLIVAQLLFLTHAYFCLQIPNFTDQYTHTLKLTSQTLNVRWFHWSRQIRLCSVIIESL